jgi:ATP-binding protein involved in chromosome partitioning
MSADAMDGAGRFDIGPERGAAMSSEQDAVLERVWSALAEVRDPKDGQDVVTSGRVAGLEMSGDGDVRFQFLLRAGDPGTLVRQARHAAEAVEGVASVRVDVKLPQSPTRDRPAGPPRQRRPAPGSVPAPTPQRDLRRGIGRVIAVSSGKGGVGKSTVAANLAAALAGQGHTVGLLDADIYGPDIPQMFGESRRPQVTGSRGAEMIVPLQAHGVKLMSLGFLLDPEQPAIMRGPLVSGVLKQFLEQVDWGELDYLIVDLPPGTGDAQLSLVQTIDIDGAVMVTTPQEVSTGDVRRGIRMFERTNTRVLGVVENMGPFRCPHCGQEIDVFGTGGGRRLAEAMGLPFLGTVPLDPDVRRAGDEGHPSTLSAADSPAGSALRAIAGRVTELVGAPAPAGS